jgi:uncharacterized integral membrane protein
MHFAHVIQGRKERVWAVLIVLAIIGILIAVFVLLSGRSPRPFEMDDLYGWLD